MRSGLQYNEFLRSIEHAITGAAQPARQIDDPVIYGYRGCLMKCHDADTALHQFLELRPVRGVEERMRFIAVLNPIKVEYESGGAFERGCLRRPPGGVG